MHGRKENHLLGLVTIGEDEMRGIFVLARFDCAPNDGEKVDEIEVDCGEKEEAVVAEESNHLPDIVDHSQKGLRVYGHVFEVLVLAGLTQGLLQVGLVLLEGGRVEGQVLERALIFIVAGNDLKPFALLPHLSVEEENQLFLSQGFEDLVVGVFELQTNVVVALAVLQLHNAFDFVGLLQFLAV